MVKRESDGRLTAEGKALFSLSPSSLLLCGRAPPRQTTNTHTRREYVDETRGSVERGELKPGGARAVPEDACGACWERGSRRWMANTLVQARTNSLPLSTNPLPTSLPLSLTFSSPDATAVAL
eukprot:scaffold3335_cov139-Skeletonema_marinoi.AAC.3